MNDSKINRDAVVFDFDGTLATLNIDFVLMRKSVMELIENYGVSSNHLGHLFVLEMIEAGRSLILNNFPLRASDFIHQANAVIEHIEVEAAKNGHLIDGTKEMLTELKERKIKTGVVTRNCRAAINQVFPDIIAYFDSIVTREQTPHVKPHPEHLRLTLKRMQVKPESAVMVGDHPMDIKIGQDVGLFTIGVLTGASSERDLVLAKADVILKKAAYVVNVLS